MIVTLSRYRVGEAADVADDLGCDVCISMDKQSSIASLGEKWLRVVNARRVAYLDMRWYRPGEPPWFQALCSAGRSAFDTTEAVRRDVFNELANRFPSGPLIAPSGPANDVQRSLDLGRELTALRDADYQGRPVFASVTLNRQGLNDTVLTQFIPPVGIQGFLITVLDATTYPSIWSETEWFTYMRLVATLARNQYAVILTGSDIRGLVASSLGDIQFTTGVSREDRQVPQDVAESTSGGGNAPVSYLSAPLLTVLHGERLAVDANARVAGETHRRCQPFGRLEAPSRGVAFDPDWLQSAGTTGDQIRSRIARHLRDLRAVEEWLRSQGSQPDAMEHLLEHSAAVGGQLPADIFKSPGSREELGHRLRAFTRVRQALSI